MNRQKKLRMINEEKIPSRSRNIEKERVEVILINLKYNEDMFFYTVD